MTPERIGKYQIVGKLGQGAMGEVFRGHDPVLNRFVAIKRISSGLDADETLKKRFRRDMNREEALRVAIEALIDASDEDLGTGGPDLMRGILPSVKTITRSGFSDAGEDEIRRHCEVILNDRERL